jgi:hypothetical protein
LCLGRCSSAGIFSKGREGKLEGRKELDLRAMQTVVIVFWLRNRLAWEFLNVCECFILRLMMCCGVRSVWRISTARELACPSTN